MDTRQAKTLSGMNIKWTAEHRDGICENCDVQMELREVKITSTYYDKQEEKTVTRAVCPQCGGMKGRLIVRGVSIQPPKIPSCLAFHCLVKYFKDSLLCALLASYHSRRVTYAENNKDKKILERYRTGEPAPETIWQAIHANIKLKCPVCRKYNVDPFLFRRK